MARTYRAIFNCHDRDDLSLIQPSLHYQTDLSGIGSEPDPDDVAAGIWTLLGSAFTAACTTRVAIDSIDVVEQVIPPTVAVGGTHVVGVNGTLAVANQDLPRALCIGINLKTATRSRSSRGFFHLPGALSTSYIGAHIWGGAYVTNANTFAALLDDSFDLGVVDPTHVHPVVYSRKRHKEGDTPYTFQITAASASTKVRYLRSRDTSP